MHRSYLHLSSILSSQSIITLAILLTSLILHTSTIIIQQQLKLPIQTLSTVSLSQQYIQNPQQQSIQHKQIILPKFYTANFAQKLSQIQQQSAVVKFTFASNLSYTAYSNNTINPLFSLPPHTYSCINLYTFTYNQSYQQFSNNSPYLLSISNYINNFTIHITDIDTTFQRLTPQPSLTYCQYQCNITIRNNCADKRGYDGIQIYIQGLPIITFNVNCYQNDIASPFQFGLVILVVLSCLQIFICSKYQQANSMHNIGHYINYCSLGIFCVIMIIGQIFIIVQVQDFHYAINYITIALSFVFGILGTMVCFCEIVWLTNFSFIKRNVFKNKIIQIRYMDILGFLLGLGLLLCWFLLNKNWIVSDIIYCMMFLAIVKCIKFGSLKIATITLLSTAGLNLLFIILTQTIKHAYFNNIILYIFNNPFFIFCPCINYTPNQSCSWLFITCIAFPGLLLSYLQRFDESRASKVYTVSFITTFSIFSALWLVVSVFVPFTIPFDMVTSPICIIIISIFALKRGQLKSVWTGHIYDPKSKDRLDEQNSLQTTLRDQRRTSYKSEWFKIKLSQISGSSVENAAKMAIQQKNMQNRSQKVGNNGTVQLKQLNSLKQKGKSTIK